MMAPAVEGDHMAGSTRLMRPCRNLLFALIVAVTAFGAARSSLAAGKTYVLAVSWQPAFCETRPEKPECISQTDERFDASNFTLHGLWPQPRSNVYCGVEADLQAIDRAGGWEDLPAPDLTAETRKALDQVMPGVASFLDRHEWVKHGTCHANSAEVYFSDSLRLLSELNASPVRTVFSAGIGRVLSAQTIRERFDEAFGPGAGRRVEVICRRVGIRRLIVELKISLAGPIAPGRGLQALLDQAPETSAGCAAGIVDRVGTGLSDPPSSTPVSPTR